MKNNLQIYTLKYLSVTLLVVIAVWAVLFYAFLTEEVFDNIDDGLKSSKIEIIREAYLNPELLKTSEYGIGQFKITPLPDAEEYSYKNEFISTELYSEYEGEDEPMRILKTIFKDSEGKHHQLEVKTSMVEEDELMTDISFALVTLYLMLVISVMAINYIVLKRVWKPFYELLNQLKNYKIDNLSEFKSPESPIGEFNSLGEELESMITRNEKIYEQQKQFIGNASHELQTPLAITINKLELLMENPSFGEEELNEAHEVLENLQRMVRLNKSLLILSRIDNRQFLDEELVNFNETITKVIHDYAELIEFKNINIELNFEDEFLLKINKELAFILISNLLKNAIYHNNSKDRIIIINVLKDKISFKNPGENQLNKSVVFERFYKAVNDSKSTGLGLAIVKSIADNHGGILAKYHYDGMHVFEIKKI